MRNWSFILFILFTCGCSEDALVPCNSDQPTGKVCREYRYYNDQPQGFVQFDHQGDSALVSEIYGQQSALLKTVREQFVDGKTSVITEQFPEEVSRVQSWHYNEMDSLSMIVYGANDSSLLITYDEGKRYRETMIVDDVAIRFSQYRYYQDDGLLYRITEYNGNDSVLSYRNFDYFNGNDGTFYRATFYTAEHELIGRRRYSFSQNGLISSMEFRLADGTLAESKEYIYDSAGKLTEEHGQQYGNTSKSVYLYN